MLPHVRRRPVTMERFPSGIGAKGFLQKNVVKGFPEWLERAELPKKDGTVHYPLANDARSLQWMANQNTVTLHVWTSRMPDARQPDVCVFDLDPARGRSRAAADRGARPPRPARRARAAGGGQDVRLEGLPHRRAAEAHRVPRGRPLRRRDRRRADRAAARSRDAGVQQGGSRRPHLRRHRPQPARRDGGRRLHGAGAARRAGVRAVHLGGNRAPRRRPAHVHPADDGGAARRGRRSVEGPGAAAASSCPSSPPRNGPAYPAATRARRWT